MDNIKNIMANQAVREYISENEQRINYDASGLMAAAAYLKEEILENLNAFIVPGDVEATFENIANYSEEVAISAMFDSSVEIGDPLLSEAFEDKFDIINAFDKLHTKVSMVLSNGPDDFTAGVTGMRNILMNALGEINNNPTIKTAIKSADFDSKLSYYKNRNIAAIGKIKADQEPGSFVGGITNAAVDTKDFIVHTFGNVIDAIKGSPEKVKGFYEAYTKLDWYDTITYTALTGLTFVLMGMMASKYIKGRTARIWGSIEVSSMKYIGMRNGQMVAFSKTSLDETMNCAEKLKKCSASIKATDPAEVTKAMGACKFAHTSGLLGIVGAWGVYDLQSTGVDTKGMKTFGEMISALESVDKKSAKAMKKMYAQLSHISGEVGIPSDGADKYIAMYAGKKIA